MGLFDILFGRKKGVEPVVCSPEPVIDEDVWKDYSLERSREELIAQMKAAIDASFPEYEVICPMEASELDPNCHPACTPVHFMFKKEGRCVLAAVIVKNNTYKGMNVLGTKRICEELGIPYIRFFEECPNQEEYVVNRIRENLSYSDN